MYKYTYSDKFLSSMAIIDVSAFTPSVQFLSSGTSPENIFFSFLFLAHLYNPFVHLFKELIGCFFIKITSTMDRAKN